MNNTKEQNLWEEGNSIEQSKKFENNGIIDQNDIIKKTRKRSSKYVWKIIGNKRVWIRNCPKCKREIQYSYLQSICLATKRNYICRQCVNLSYKDKFKGTNNPNYGKSNYYHWLKKYGKEIADRKQKESNEKNRQSNLGCKNGFYGKHHKKEVIDKLKIDERVRHYGIENGFYGEHHTDKTKQKLSISTKSFQTGRPKSPQERINLSKSLKGKKKSPEHRAKCIINGKIGYIEWKRKHNTLKTGYNPDACKYFDELNKQNGWNLQHALNGGEKRVLCYFVDAYDKKRNIVVEYDEKHHYDFYGDLKEKDTIRMNDIIKHLNCKFFRYNEQKQLLTEIKTDGNMIL